MRILISPTSREEAQIICESGAHIVDVKNVTEGSLGANFPWVTREIVALVRRYDLQCSATLGDLPNKPGTAALAAAGLAATGVHYLKAGLYGVDNYDNALYLMRSISRACREINPKLTVVAAGYADYRRFNGLPSHVLVQVARDAGADLVMIDTAIKDGQTLFDNLSYSELQDFVGQARVDGLQVALAGSIGFEHLDLLAQLKPDLIGIRGCVCHHSNRNLGIDSQLVNTFLNAASAMVTTV
jgi:uncharacterized protein (UPF0264 family)